MSGARFAWECLGSPEWLPPAPKRGAERFGPDGDCWLCGGPTEGVGWPWRLAISPTFTNHTLAAAPWSQTVCQACVYMGSGEAWRAYCETRPDREWKAVPPLSWRSYSHVFWPGYHDCPKRGSWRALLLEPPEPPFLLVVAESGQKHIVYRAVVGRSREVFPVQVEEERVLVDRDEFRACVEAFEALLAMGFTRDEVVSGRYSQGRLARADRVLWRAAEAEMDQWRRRRPDYMRLAHMVAHGPTKEGAA